MPEIYFNELKHTYEVDGKIVPSVTQILKGAGIGIYVGIPEDVLKYAADRSVAVHAACEYYDDGDLDPDSLDPQVAAYLAGWHSFTLENAFEIIESEQIHAGCLHGMYFGMRLDRVVKFADNDRPTILDIKCTKEIKPSHGVQLAGYACGLYVGPEEELAENRLEFYDRAVVQLRPDGTYQIHEFHDLLDGEIFACALRIAHWQASHSNGRRKLF